MQFMNLLVCFPWFWGRCVHSTPHFLPSCPFGELSSFKDGFLAARAVCYLGVVVTVQDLFSCLPYLASCHWCQEFSAFSLQEASRP